MAVAVTGTDSATSYITGGTTTNPTPLNTGGNPALAVISTPGGGTLVGPTAGTLVAVPSITSVGTTTTPGTVTSTTSVPTYGNAVPAGYGALSGINALPQLGEGVYIPPGQYTATTGALYNGVVGQLATYGQTSPAGTTTTTSANPALRDIALIGIIGIMLLAGASLLGAFK